MQIEIKSLTKSFSYVKALNGIDLKIDCGETLSIFGPNGAGKTTMLRILSTLINMTSGVVRIGDYDIKKNSYEIRKNIGFLSHEKFLYNNLTAFENLKFFSELYGVNNSADLSMELLKKVGIFEKKDELASKLSSGMKQRLSIARALINDPKILLLDEPFTGLDPKGINIISSILNNLKSTGKTILLTTHNLALGLELGDRFVILNSGKIAYQKPCSELNIDILREEYSQITS